MALNDASKNVMLDHWAGLAVFASLHTANPGTTGTSEVAGGSPAYARKAITWNAAAAGILDSSNVPTFDVPPATTVTHVGYWSAVTAGTFYGWGEIVPETFVGQGSYPLNDADVAITG